MTPVSISPRQFWGQVATVLTAIVVSLLWINRRFNEVDRRFNEVDRHFSQVDLRFSEVDLHFERMGRRFDGVGLRLAALEHQNRSLLKAFPQLISGLMTAQVLPPARGTDILTTALEAGAIDDFLAKLRPGSNPITREDITRLRSYVARLKGGELLTPEEARDFYRLSDSLTREHPTREESWTLFVLAGIVVGLVLGSPRK